LHIFIIGAKLYFTRKFVTKPYREDTPVYKPNFISYNYVYDSK